MIDEALPFLLKLGAQLGVAFLGSGVATFLVELLFVRRKAFAEALGQEHAKRRADLLERLATLVEETFAAVEKIYAEAQEIEPQRSGTARSVEQIAFDFDKLNATAALYFSHDLVDALGSFRKQVYDMGFHGPSPIDEGWPSLSRMRQKLIEAAQGKHTP